MPQARRYGYPRTDAERWARHSRLYPNDTSLPPRGTGLRRISYDVPYGHDDEEEPGDTGLFSNADTDTMMSVGTMALAAMVVGLVIVGVRKGR